MSEQSGIIDGVVLDRDGRPVIGASVFVLRAPVDMPDIAALTDARGAFTLSVPGSGVYTLQCTTADGRGDQQTVSADRGARVALHWVLGNA